MTDKAFEFTRVDDFLDNINRADKFDTADMDGTSLNYKFLLVSSCPVNIEDCLDQDGTLNDKVNIVVSENAEDGLCALLWSKGVNGERTISVSSSTINYELDEPTDIQAIFLVNVGNADSSTGGSGYVLAYSINDKVITVDGSLLCPVDGVAWTIRYED